jgi:hypothetical protein
VDKSLSDKKTESLNKFKKRRELWKKCLLGDDPNAIANQMKRREPRGLANIQHFGLVR